MGYALVLPDSLADPPESICHQRGGSDEVHGGAEAAGRQVSLVLDGAVAANRRHILRHGEGVWCGVNWSVGLVMRSCEVAASRPQLTGVERLAFTRLHNDIKLIHELARPCSRDQPPTWSLKSGRRKCGNWHTRKRETLP